MFGAAGHAKVLLDILRLVGGIVIAGLVDDFKPVGYKCLGFEVVGGLGALSALAKDLGDPAVVMGVGDNWRRAQIVDEIRKQLPSTRFPTVIHPSAQIGSEVSIAEGTVIMAGSVVNAGSKIGPFCIVNTRSSLDHDSTMGEYSSLAPGVTTGGQVNIGAFSNIGLGATVLPSIRIGAHSVVGAGSVVVKPIPDHVIAYGIPAKAIRPRHNGDRYLSAVSEETRNIG